jgi:hypothetical protein
MGMDDEAGRSVKEAARIQAKIDAELDGLTFPQLLERSLCRVGRTVKAWCPGKWVI